MCISGDLGHEFEVEVEASRDCSGCKNTEVPMIVDGREAEVDDLDFDVEEKFWIALLWAKPNSCNRRDSTQAESLVVPLVVLMSAVMERVDIEHCIVLRQNVTRSLYGDFDSTF
jgi:hypothetical protein